MREGYGNGGAGGNGEKQKQLSHSFHRPLEISQRRRDSHIPTAPSGGLFSNPKPQDKRTLDDDDEAHADADRNSYRRPILAAAGFQPASRLKGGCSPDWLPHLVFKGIRRTGL